MQSIFSRAETAERDIMLWKERLWGSEWRNRPLVGWGAHCMTKRGFKWGIGYENVLPETAKTGSESVTWGK